MNKRIKIIYLLTIFGILAFCGLEGYWLYKQYQDHILGKAAEMYIDIITIADETVKQQTDRETAYTHAIYRIDNMINGDTTRYSGYIAILDKQIQQQNVNHINELIDSGMTPDYVIEVLHFNDVDVSKASSKEFTEAVTRFRVYNKVPLDIDSIAIKVEKQLGASCRVQLTQEEPNRIWSPKIFLPDNILHPTVTVVYPYNPIDGGAVKIAARVPLGEPLKNMMFTFAIALTVASLLIACLALQIKTIRRQQKIADFQKNYTLTMLHELKRPIGALKLFISFMRNPRLDDNDRAEALENGAKEVDNLASYFEKLRAITCNEASDSPLSLSTFDLVDTTRECAGNSIASIHVKSSGECILTADRQSIANVVANLIENAVKYSPENAPIEINVLEGSNFVKISVADRGRGVPDSDKTRIFDRFYRSGDSKDIPGIGLGLAYVKQVVNAHGGSISVADRDGGGSVFTIKIPQ